MEDGEGHDCPFHCPLHTCYGNSILLVGQAKGLVLSLDIALSFTLHIWHTCDIFRVQTPPIFQLSPPWPQLVLACMQFVFTGQPELSYEICQLSDHATPLLNSLHSPHILRNKAKVINFFKWLATLPLWIHLQLSLALCPNHALLLLPSDRPSHVPLKAVASALLSDWNALSLSIRYLKGIFFYPLKVWVPYFKLRLFHLRYSLSLFLA